MGWRNIELDFEEQPAETTSVFLNSLVSFARYKKIAGSVHAPRSYPGSWTMTIEANSSYLNGITPEFIETAKRMMLDIDPINVELSEIVGTIESQLTAQIVDWTGIPGLTLARAGRELEERIEGEASFVQLELELTIHTKRVRSHLARYHRTSGPRAWRKRIEIAQLLRIDSLAVINTARKLRRIAIDLQKRLPGSHLAEAIRTFDKDAPKLVLMRNIAEHIDEYSIGQGRLDANPIEPGKVISINISPTDLVVTARATSLGISVVYDACVSLIGCLRSASEYYMVTHLFPPVADFDFTVTTSAGTEIVARTSESLDQLEIRARLTEIRGNLPELPPANCCPSCGERL